MRRAMGATILTGATMLLITATHRGGSHSFSCGGSGLATEFPVRAPRPERASCADVERRHESWQCRTAGSFLRTDRRVAKLTKWKVHG